jgi:hypothetical protein
MYRWDVEDYLDQLGKKENRVFRGWLVYLDKRVK